MRSFQIGPPLANQLIELRRRDGRTEPCRLRLEDIQTVEKAFKCTLPHAVLAYLAAGVPVFGDGPLSVARIRELTLSVRELAEEYDLEGEDRAQAKRLVVFDDDSNGNYLAVDKAASRDSQMVIFVDHEGFDLVDRPLDKMIMSGVDTDDREALLRVRQAKNQLEIEVYSKPDPEPEVRWVTHKKFGRGAVLELFDDKVKVRFEDGLEKTLKTSFVQFV